jgi:acetylornithine/succinyldiaminopimelate/putrescine aminotransferase
MKITLKDFKKILANFDETYDEHEIIITDGHECKCYTLKNAEIKEFIDEKGKKYLDIGIGGCLISQSPTF